ncbi:MAG: tetratricopeptide repeat-containing sensor histidine kinase [Bacteroidales bacterium]
MKLKGKLHKILLIIVFFVGTKAFSQENEKELVCRYTIMAENLILEGNSDFALNHLNITLKKALKLKDDSLLTIVYRQLGQLYEIKGNYKYSINNYLKAISYCNKSNLINEKAKCYKGLSNVDFRTGNNELALENCMLAIEIFKTLNDTAEFIASSSLKAQVYLGLNKIDEARQIYNLLLNLAIQTNDSANLVYIYDHIGAVHSFKSDYDSALFYMEKALKINGDSKRPVYRAIIYGNMGEMYMCKGLYEEAIKFLKLAYEIERESDFKSGMIFLHYTLGQTYSRMGDAKNAESEFNNCLKLIAATGESREKPIVYQLLSEHYERSRNYIEALKYLKLKTASADSLGKISNELKIEELKIKNDFEEIENELNISKKSVLLQKYIIALIGSGFLSIIIFSVFIYRSQRKLKKANKSKKLLFSIIGHDLRGLVGSINQMLDLIDISEDDKKLFYLDKLKQPAQSSLLLLDNLLDWSKTGEKSIAYNPIELDISEIFISVKELLKPLAERKNIKVNIVLDQNYKVFADENQVKTIIRNLLSNAIKFTNIEGFVDITGKKEAKNLRIIVKDNGIGMEKNIVDKILKGSFYSGFGTQSETGSGLGLSICKEFIKKNKGKFFIESMPGKGSSFQFTLPLSKVN